MTPTQTGFTTSITVAATTLVGWALLGFPIHQMPDVPPQVEAIAGAIVAVGSWAVHFLATKPWMAETTPTPPAP